MTAQPLEQKRRKKKQSVDEIFDWAREQFLKADELYHKRKRDVILEVARRLEESEFEQNKISSEIIHRLNGFVDPSYVNKVLTDFPQYKEQYRVKNVEKRNFSRNIPTKSASESEDNTASDSKQQFGLSAKQPGPKEVQSRFNIAPEEYELERLHEYDKDLLIRIVKWIDGANDRMAQLGFKYSDEIVELRTENAALKRQILS